MGPVNTEKETRMEEITSDRVDMMPEILLPLYISNDVCL